MILHDPPGDQSYSYISQGTSFCNSLYFDAGYFAEVERGLNVSVGPQTTLVSGFGVATETTIDIEASIDVSASLTTAGTITNTAEVCQELMTQYSTDTDEFLVGDTSDIYIGGAPWDVMDVVLTYFPPSRGV